MEKAILLLLATNDLPLHFLRFKSKSISSEKEDPYSHALFLLLKNSKQSLAFLASEGAHASNKQRAVQLLVWLCNEFPENVLASLSFLFDDALLGFQTLSLLSYSFPKLQESFIEELIPLVFNHFLQGDKNLGPTTCTLLARDFIWHLIWKLSISTTYVIREDFISEALAGCLAREAVWVDSHSPVLFVALKDLQHCKRIPSLNCLSLLANRDHVLLAKESKDFVFYALKNTASPASDLHEALLEACLIQGRIPDESFLQEVVPYAMKVLGSPLLSKSTHILAGSLVRSIVRKGEDVSTVLLPLLDESDTVSIAACELLAEAVFQDPKTIFNELSNRLSRQETSVGKKELGLRILSRILELRRTVVQDDWDQKLVNLLMSVLSDEKLAIRTLGSHICVLLLLSSGQKWEPLLLPQLFNTVSQSEVRLRAIASETIIELFAQAQDNLPFLLHILLSRVPLSQQEAVFSLTPKWLAKRKLPPLNEFALEEIVSQCCAQAHDAPHLFGFARKVAVFAHEREDYATMQMWVSLLLPRLVYSNETTSAVNQLAPFLLLRVFPSLPPKSLETDTFERLIQCLCQASFSVNTKQLSDVRRVCIEVLARLDSSSLPWNLFLTILSSKSDTPTDMQSALMQIVPGGGKFDLEAEKMNKAALFGCCQILAGNLLRNNLGVDSFPNALVAQVLLPLLDVKVDLEPGLADYFSLALVCEGFLAWEQLFGKHVLDKPVKVEEVEEQQQQQVVALEEFPSFEMVWALWGKNPHAKQFACSVLILIARGFLTPKEGSPTTSLIQACLQQYQQQHLHTNNRVARAGWGFIHRVLFTLLSQSERESKDASSYFSLAFTCCFVNMRLFPDHSALDSFAFTQLMNECIHWLGSSVDANKALAIRLVGVLLTFPTPVLQQLPDGTLGRVQVLLSGISHLDPSSEARVLSSEILKSFDSKQQSINT